MKVLLDTEKVKEMVDEVIFDSRLYDKLQEYIKWQSTVPECIKFDDLELDKIDDNIVNWFGDRVVEGFKRVMIEWDEDE